LRADGQVVAWGSTNYSALDVPPSATNIVEIAATWHANIALRADGKILTWGLLDPAIPGQPPTAVFVEAAGGGGFGGGGMVLRQDGTVISSSAPASATNIMTIGASGTAYLAAKAMGPPIFPLPAVSRTVVAGRRAYFKLRTVGARPIKYQWSLYGTNLPAATNAVLVVTNVQRANTGPYVLTASNALGVTISSPMMLNMEASALTIQKTATNTLMISWPSPSTGFDLKMNTDLASTNWSTPPESVGDNGAIKFIIVDPSMASRFYRLVYP
jgi:hypothetical protein